LRGGGKRNFFAKNEDPTKEESIGEELKRKSSK